MAEEDDKIITCWCGARGTYDELFDDSGLEDGCAGTGHLNCFCGGDQCVCHHHGGSECDGCDDCDNGYEHEDDDDDLDDEPDYGFHDPYYGQPCHACGKNPCQCDEET